MHGQTMSGEGKIKVRSILLIVIAVGLCYTCHLRLLLDVDKDVNCINIDENVVSSIPLINREYQCLFAC